MRFNSPVIIIAALIIIALILFIIVKNRKDKKELENKLNQDYHKPPRHPKVPDVDDVKSD